MLFDFLAVRPGLHCGLQSALQEGQVGPSAVVVVCRSVKQSFDTFVVVSQNVCSCRPPIVRVSFDYAACQVPFHIDDVNYMDITSTSSSSNTVARPAEKVSLRELVWFRAVLIPVVCLVRVRLGTPCRTAMASEKRRGAFGFGSL